MTRQPVRAGVQVRERYPSLVGDQRDRVRGLRRLPVEQLRQRRRRNRVCGGVRRGEYGRVTLIGQRDVTHRDRRIGEHRPQHRVQACTEPRHCLRLEQVGGVGDVALDPGRAGLLDHDQVQIELRDPRVDLDLRDPQTGQLERGRRQVLEREADLDQRVPRRRPDRVEHLDESLERHVGVRERTQVPLPRRGQQRVEAGRRVHVAAEHHGVDEHPDQLVQRAVAAARHRAADGDVGGARQPGQQHRERTVQQHEHRHVVRAGQIRQRRVGGGVDGERHPTATMRLHRGPRPVRGQRQLVRQPGQCLRPVGQLTRGERLRIGFVAEQLVLPQREVGVLDRQRRPVRCRAGPPRGVGDHDVAGQRRERPTVAGDVVQHHHEHVLVRADPQQRTTQRYGRGDVERLGGELQHPLLELPRRNRFHRELRERLRGGQYHLHRTLGARKRRGSRSVAG